MMKSTHITDSESRLFDYPYSLFLVATTASILIAVERAGTVWFLGIFSPLIYLGVNVFFGAFCLRIEISNEGLDIQYLFLSYRNRFLKWHEIDSIKRIVTGYGADIRINSQNGKFVKFTESCVGDCEQL